MRAPLFRYIRPLATVLVIFASMIPSFLAQAAPARGRAAADRNSTLRKRVGAEKVPLENPSALARTIAKIKEAKAGKATVRITHLGDSHVASDYITGTVRAALQAEYGDAGRGFIAIDQQKGYGGRRLERSDTAWTADRIVDKGREGQPFGFSGNSIESKQAKAKVSFELMGDEPTVKLYYQAKPDGGALEAMVDGKKVAELETKDKETYSRIFSFETKVKKGGKHKLELVAKDAHVRLYGISFEKNNPGVFYDTIGPVGADAKVYLDLERNSFIQHFSAHAPDLVVLMVGGNDAMKIRKGWTDLAKVRRDQEELVDLVKSTVPRAECLIWAPMDAGEKQGKTIVSKTFLKEVRDMQREIAKAKGCGFWDMYQSMGGDGAFGRWSKANIMNADLVHPKEKAAELLGDLFVGPFEDLVGD